MSDGGRVTLRSCQNERYQLWATTVTRSSHVSLGPSLSMLFLNNDLYRSHLARSIYWNDLCALNIKYQNLDVEI